MFFRIIPSLVLFLMWQLTPAIAEEAKTYPPYQLKRSEVTPSIDGYFYNVENQIGLCWFPPKVTEEMRVTLKFTLDKNGNVEHSEYLKRSASKEFDEAAVDAIYAESFGAVPSGYGKGEITYTFVVYVDRKRMEAEKTEKEIIREKAYLGDQSVYRQDAEENFLKNPKSVVSRLAMLKNILNFGDREEAIYYLEEGINLLPKADIFKNVLSRIKAHNLN